MQDRALDHSLETRGWLWISAIFGLQRLVFLVEILLHDFAQLGQIHPASGHDLRCIFIINQREQQMLQRGIFMPTLGCVSEGIVQRSFEVLGKTWHVSTL